MSTRIYGVIWMLLHVLVSVYESLRWLTLRLQAAMLWSYDQLCRGREKREYALLELCKTRLSKLPRHLSIIVGADDVQVDGGVLARIFSYAAFMDFDCISLYDTRLPENGHIAVENLRVPKGVLCKELQEHHFVWSISQRRAIATAVNGTTKAAASNGAVNNQTKPTNKSIEIYELTYSDGRTLIADVCRTLYEQRHSADVKQLLQDRKQLEARINIELSQRLHNVTESELCIIFSQQMCTYGLLPWHTRFTEFHRFPTGGYFDAQEFAKVLCKYARCEQRWGT